MATQQFTVEDDRYQQEPPVRRTNWLKGCLLGCLGAVVVLLIVGVVATIWVSRNWRNLAASTMSTGLKQGIDATELPAQEKAQIKAEIDRGADLFATGRISGAQATKLIQKAVESPLMTTIIASAAEKKYIDVSGLGDQEKAEANVTLQRFLRGAFDEKINRASIDAALAHVADKRADNNWRFREKVSDAELRSFLADARKAADEAKIPEQIPSVDPSDEVKRIIDETLAASPDAEPAPPLVIPPPAESPPKPEAEAENQSRDAS